MENIVMVSEFDQRTQRKINTVFTRQQEVIVEESGQQIAVIISSIRYQTLLKIAHLWVKERFLDAQQAIYQATLDIPLEEIDRLIAEVIQESRQQRGKVHASCA